MIINKTPHPINLVTAEGKAVTTFPKCLPEELIRLAVTTVAAEEIEGVSTSVTVFGEPTGLPDFAEGTYYIVSQLVKAALPSRSDLLVPAEVLRNESGAIIGCQSLGR